MVPFLKTRSVEFIEVTLVNKIMWVGSGQEVNRYAGSLLEKGSPLQCGARTAFVCRKSDLNVSLAHYAEINLKWIIEVTVNSKTIKVLGGKPMTSS